MDLQEIRRLIIIAVCSDDLFLETLVLKGGNALNLVHRIGLRTSLDIDFSMAGDFDDLAEIRKRLFRALKDRFDSAGYFVFDEKFGPRPKQPSADPRWGGYRAEFKLIAKKRFEKLRGDLESLRRQSLSVDGTSNASRIFTVEISKFEFCEGKEERELDDFTLYVYTPAMIAAEKLRALCQQMPECEPKAKQVARARDFYDIYEIVETASADFREEVNRELVRKMFEAKNVSLRLLGKLKDTRAFHAQDWPALRDALGTNAEGDFDFYFDAVLRIVEEKLKPLWVE